MNGCRLGAHARDLIQRAASKHTWYVVLFSVTGTLASQTSDQSLGKVIRGLLGALYELLTIRFHGAGWFYP